MLLAAWSTYGQPDYTTVGLRGGGTSGITLKYVDRAERTFEGIIGWKDNGFRFTGVTGNHKPVMTGRFSNMFMVTALGGHAGYIRYDDTDTRVDNGITYYSCRKRFAPVIGMDFMVGLEYRFFTAPIWISLDYKPYLEFFGEHFFRVDMWDFGLTVRYVMNQ
ncbi:MAG: hypothetical protein JW861_03475 [Bacteroidales bacterium]|nr:hypothetical protein [Bacteroidales bacterium]